MRPNCSEVGVTRTARTRAFVLQTTPSGGDGGFMRVCMERSLDAISISGSAIITYYCIHDVAGVLNTVTAVFVDDEFGCGVEPCMNTCWETCCL